MEKLSDNGRNWNLEKLAASAFVVGSVVSTVLSLSMGHLYLAIPLALAAVAYLKENADQQRLAGQPSRALNQ